MEEIRKSYGLISGYMQAYGEVLKALTMAISKKEVNIPLEGGLYADLAQNTFDGFEVINTVFDWIENLWHYATTETDDE